MSDENGNNGLTLPPDEQIIAEATLSVLETIRGPEGAETRLRAAQTLLTFYKGKPSTKSELSISKAEDWLAGIASEAAKGSED
jgi:hypothetical protein